MAGKKTGKLSKNTKPIETSGKKSNSGNGSGKKSKPASANGKKSQNNSKNNKRKNIEEIGSRGGLGNVIAAIVMIAIGVFFVISLHTDVTGALGRFIADLFEGLFGLAAFISAYFILIYGILMLFRMAPTFRLGSFLMLIMLQISIVMLNSTRFLESGEIGTSLTSDVFHQGADLKNGGLVGMYMDHYLHKVIGTGGIYILGITLLMVALLMLLDTPLSRFFEKSKDFKEARREKKIQQMLLREELDEGDGRSSLEFQNGKAGKESQNIHQMSFEELPFEPDNYEMSHGYANDSSKNGKTDGRIFTGNNVSELSSGGFNQTSVENTENNDFLSSSNLENKTSIKETLFGRNFLNKLRGLSENGMNSSNDMGDDAKATKWDKNISKNKRNILDLVDNESKHLGVSDETGEIDTPDSLDDGFGFDGFIKNRDASIQKGKFADIMPESVKTGYINNGLESFNGNDKISDGEPEKNAEGKSNSEDHSFESPKSMDRDILIGGASVATARSETESSDGDVSVSPIKRSRYKLPPIDLLRLPDKTSIKKESPERLSSRAMLLENTLKSFGVDAKVINVISGPSVTRYEIQPQIGVKVQSITRLTDDIALNMRARSIRIEAPIPGKAAVGIEIENESRQPVTIREILGSDLFRRHKSKLAFSVGRDIGGNPVVADLGKMPHLLIAGATGSGKSVCINTIIASILYKAKPEEVKMILIDPKMVELGNYNGIPHLLIPVVTDANKAAGALNWAVAEMTERYKKFASNGVRDIGGYNQKMKLEKNKDEILPQIVIIIDELSDLMMVASNQVEDAICRLAQLARAAGMHLVVATQRPSVDVITGLIKANIPSRIAFMVSSQIDSRTIIDMPGAEKLVGNGDMLFKPQDLNKPKRIQGPFISDDEVLSVIEYVRDQVGEAEYNEEVIEKIERGREFSGDTGEDELMMDAIGVVVNAGHASASMLQRRFRIGYNRAARLIDIMESRGIVGPPDGSRPRQVLITDDEYENMKNG